MAHVIDGFVFAEDVLEGFMIETRSALGGGDEDWMQVECVHWTEYGIMFYGTERLSGKKYFTVPVPSCSLITGWKQ
jgi:hypothetical protein